MNLSMVKPEKFGHFHVGYHFTVPSSQHCFFFFFGAFVSNKSLSDSVIFLVDQAQVRI